MRRMIIACDGTGQSASREIKPTTNVIRFCHALSTNYSPTPENKDPAQQLIFYQSGIGTAASGIIHDAYAEGTGLGIDDNILDAYTFIMNNYIQDDELYIFGFSRGAFTARVLAGLIIQLGILKTNHLPDLKKAFKAYRTSVTEWKAYLETFHNEVNNTEKPLRTQEAIIQVVGCWDTVGSVGLPVIQPVLGWFSGSSGVYDPRLLGGASSDSFPYFAKVKHAFHALSLDEVRRPFSPSLWYLPKGHTGTVLEQCWFAGVHSNVGGGYEDTAMADLALAWMIDRCTPFLAFDEKELDHIADLHRKPKPKPDPFPKDLEYWDAEHQGWGKGHMYDSYGKSFYTVKAQGWRYRRPGEYGDKEGAAGLSVGTKEMMHASIRERWNIRHELKNGWKPESLNGFVPRQTESGKWEWFRAGKGGKPEVKIEEAFMEEGCFEARLRDGPHWVRSRTALKGGKPRQNLS